MAYLALSTANLPDPTIDPAQGASPADHFNTVTYSGNSSNPASVTGVGFQPDFVWVKTRSFGNTDHRLQDVVRGSNKRLESNTTDAETDAAGGIQSFDSDGFTVGDGTSKDGFIHFGGRTFVAWNWKANGSGSSNTDGSITSTVSANTTSGFSIVSYVADGTNTSSVGHGLDQKPDIVIQKNRDTASDWLVLTDLIDGSNDYLLLNSTAAAASAAGGSNATTFVSWDRPSGDNMICYAFHSVDGFSKIGKYVGNGSTDGPFVYTGFRPAWLMIKRSDGGTENWTVLDTQRSSINGMDDVLKPDSSAAEVQFTNDMDFLSNGFKFNTGTGAVNTSSATYIYMAFAENPFKYSNAR